MTLALQQDSRAIVARRMVLIGRVQGIGLRPAVARLAAECSLAGQVRNTAAGVEIEVEGSPASLEQLMAWIAQQGHLRLANSGPLEPRGVQGFSIAQSDAEGALAAPVPPDVAACSACLRETAEPGNRRQRYPFTSCTACGPRYSILRAMPYDREATSMAGFALCAACAREYAVPSDRRFHAQTTACSNCGPQVWAVDAGGRQAGSGSAAIHAAVACLRAGKIVALLGLGGYQLLCDAGSSRAVARLRRRKRRPVKPLAVLVENLALAERCALPTETERELLVSPSGPIVTVRARVGGGLAAEVHPGLAEVGLLLPTTPLHFLLARDFGGPLVCTSGNRENEPLAVTALEAEQRLSGIADLFLHHDRPVELPIDDSVQRVIAGRPVTLRLARGLAPLPLRLRELRPLIAFGGQHKSAVALCNGAQAALGPHVGDLDSLAAFERYQEHVERLARLYRLPLESPVAVDLHPDYAARRWAETQRRLLQEVQHHHAHIAAGMLEAGWLDRRVLGVAFDGAGYGPDGTIWGGEFLLATVHGFERVARLRPFPLLGGDAAAREPWRVALVLLAAAVGPEHPRVRALGDRSAAPLASLLRAAGNPLLSPRSSSVGRLFDAVAALAFDLRESHFEGYAAMMLESVCDNDAEGAYEFPLCRAAAGPSELDWRPLMSAVVQDLDSGASPGAVAMRFHRSLASAIARVVAGWPDVPVVLGGGVFQNRVLTELVAEALAGRELALPGIIPPGDGGLAAGQLAIALAAASSEAV